MPRLEQQVEGLDSAFVERVVDQLHELEPDTTAVLLTGSYAMGTAAVASDLDPTAITPMPVVGYRTWFEERIPDVPLHVSTAAITADGWLTKGTAPARWSLGFPAINAATYLYADAETRARLGNDPSLHHPAGAPELEDFFESVIKAKRKAHAGDELGLDGSRRVLLRSHRAS